MGSETEPAKLLLPYLQRADELQKHEPLVAYYCRLYAMERGLRIPQSGRTKTTNSLLVSLMNQLEKDKKSLTLGPEDSLYVEGFSLNVFQKADKQDRAGRADLNTAKTFYAASIFFEILNQFGELAPDLEQKQKYAAWKAADIRKALKEGRRPEAGPPAGDDDLSIPSSTLSGPYDLERSKSIDPTIPRSEPGQPPQSYDKLNRLDSTKISPSSPSYPSSTYPSHDFHPPPPTPPPPANMPENSPYTQPYHQQPPSFHQEPQNHSQTPSYPQEPQNHHQPPPQYPQEPPPLPPPPPPTYPQEPPNPPSYPQSYSSHETPSQSYPNFQSYPSFTETNSHYPTYYQGSDTSFSPQSSAPHVTTHPSNAQYHPSSGNGHVSEPAPPPTQSYQYDCNYEPPAEKIAEAHKAARFAVGALAFDDVPVAVEFLRKSLELLTNPSASQ